MARKFTCWGLAVGLSLFGWWGVWRGCDFIYRAGEIHGRYLVEERLGDALTDVNACRDESNAEQAMRLACDKALLDCSDGARFTEWQPIRNLTPNPFPRGKGNRFFN